MIYRSKRSVGEGRQSVIMNLMKVVDESLLEVREFLDEAENFEEDEENAEENTVVLLMKAVDKGLRTHSCGVASKVII